MLLKSPSSADNKSSSRVRPAWTSASACSREMPGMAARCSHGFRDFFLETLRDDVLGVNVHFPAGELGGEPRVLAALADGQRQLVFAHQNFQALARFVQFNAFQLRRFQRLRDKQS